MSDPVLADFWANKGDNITVQIDELTDPTAKCDPWIRLYSPRGTLLNLNVFSPLGAFSFTNLFNLAQREQYFRLSVP